jgi:proteasome lid subunit RPN8/RPN11
VWNNPLNAVDPSGMACTPQLLKLTGGCGPQEGVNFGSSWNPFNALQSANTPTAIFAYIEPFEGGENPNFGMVYLQPYYGNAGMSPVLFTVNVTGLPWVNPVDAPLDQKLKPPNNGTYKTLNCAGYTAARSIFPQTKAKATEFGGFIEKGPNGTYSYTPPFAGSRTSLSNFYDQYKNLLQSLPGGYSIAGWYHSHPVPPPTYPSAEAFSGQDLSASHYINAPGFVVTPTGKVLRLDPGPPAVTTRVPSNVCRGGD